MSRGWRFGSRLEATAINPDNKGRGGLKQLAHLAAEYFGAALITTGTTTLNGNPPCST
jgi:hypothetical protein